MNFAIKEVFNTLQGEGHRAGCRSVFVRFSGCNLWSGRLEDRNKGAGECARWCDTDFFGGTKHTAAELETAMSLLWPLPVKGERWCVLTGGEPSLQLDVELVELLQRCGWKVAIETNGTEETAAVYSCDWITMSPKLGAERRLRRCHELKVVLPGVAKGEGWTDEMLERLEEEVRADHYFVQPQDPADPTSHLAHASVLARKGPFTWPYAGHVARCVDFVIAHPKWRMSTQQHKLAALR